jgi:hypothetical protein
MGTEPVKMISIPAGTYVMGRALGADNEQPMHSVSLAAFELAHTEVTIDAYQACVTAGGCTVTPGVDDNDEPCNAGQPEREGHPINCVSWHQASAYCSWVGKRLPTEEEWEYAARGTDGRRFPWGDASPSNLNLCWSSSVSRISTCPVGSFPAGDSPFGVADMQGNVWEWTSSGYSDSYDQPRTDTARVSRGNSWRSDESLYVSTTFRVGRDPGVHRDDVGFRCARGDGSAGAGGATGDGAGGASSLGGASAAGGNAGSGGAAVGGSGMGGVSGDGGAVVGGDTGAGGSVTSDGCGVNLLPSALGTSSNYVGGDPTLSTDNPCGLQGAFYAFGDVDYDGPPSSARSCTLPDPLDCRDGGCTISGATLVDSTYTAWGCGIGLVLNDSGDGAKLPYSGPTKGFRVTIGGSFTQEVRVYYTYHDGSLAGTQGHDTAPFLGGKNGESPIHEPGTYTVMFDDVSCPDWESASGCQVTTAPYDIKIHIVGAESAAPFTLTVSELTPLTE